MKDKDIIKKLNVAYDVKPSTQGKAFIRKHQERELRLYDVFRMELKHCNWICMLILMGVFATSALVCDREPKLAWIYGSLMPVMVLLSIISLGRSERYGMWELEYSSRFSKMFLKMVRLLIAGAGSLLSLACLGIIMYTVAHIHLATIIMTVGIPFLLSAYFSMVILRKWRSVNNIYGCISVAVGCAILPTLENIKEILLSVPLWAAVLMAIMLAVGMAKEVNSYVRVESEELSWS